MITYRVESSTISPFVYKSPAVTINEDGEAEIVYSKMSNGRVIKKITFLSIAGYDENNQLVSYEPLDCVAQFLLSEHLLNGKLETDLVSRALINYFEFILANQKKWDEAYDEDTFDPYFDPPRPQWDSFPKNDPRARLTNLYNASLTELVLQPAGLARSTAKSYMNAVINFYKYHLAQGYVFNNPPFEHEVLPITIKAGHDSIAPTKQILIHTTDVRLTFPKSSVTDGTLVKMRRDLRPFTDKEWSLIQNILTKQKRIIKNVNGEMKLQSLAEEYCLAFLTCGYTGMRREEAASLHTGQIIKPKVIVKDGKEVYEKPRLYIGIGDVYGSLTKTKGAGNKSRTTIIPSRLMEQLYRYTQSERYKSRLAKFKAYCEAQKNAGNMAIFQGDDAIDPNKNYLFISQNGIPFLSRPSDFTSRWVEIRNTVNATQDLSSTMVGSIHNLRSTFAVNLFRRLLQRITAEKALVLVSSCLGHEDYKTTLEYLKIAQDLPSGDEIYEDVLLYLGAFDELDESELSDDENTSKDL